jgi:ABC-2 type transport system permease protein
MKLILIMALKDIKLLMRDKMSLFFTFFFPLLYAGLFGTILSGQMEGGTHAMTVLLVDQDQTEGSRTFVEQLALAQELEIVEAELETARESVRRGRNAAYIRLPPGFGRASESLFSGNPPRLQIGVDPKRQAEEGMLKGILMKYAAENQMAAFQDPEKRTRHLDLAREAAADAPPEVRESLERMFAEFEILMATSDEASEDPEEEAGFEGLYPLEVESVPVIVEREGPRNYYDISFPQGIIWGIMASTAGFAISLVVERRQGTLVRLQTAPVGRRRILGGKAAACFLTTIVIAGVLVLLALLVFGLRPQSPAFLAMAVVSTALCFVGLMMLFSVLGKTEQSAGAIGWIALMIMAMLGGGMLPLFMMPGWLRTAGSVSPVKWAILAMEGAIWRQFSLAEMLVPCAILVGVGLVSFSVGAKAFRWETGAGH